MIWEPRSLLAGRHVKLLITGLPLVGSGGDCVAPAGTPAAESSSGSVESWTALTVKLSVCPARTVTTVKGGGVGAANLGAGGAWTTIVRLVSTNRPASSCARYVRTCAPRS